MFREAFDGAMSEMFFMTYAANFAVRARGCPGMSPSSTSSSGDKSTSSDNSRCLRCGKKGHLATSAVHQDETAEGGEHYSPQEQKKAIATINSDKSLTAESKKKWVKRINGFWTKLRESAEASAQL